MNGKDCLLDTNIVIGLFANESSITEKIKSFSGSIFIPSIVLGELFYGAEQSTRKDEKGGLSATMRWQMNRAICLLMLWKTQLFFKSIRMPPLTLT